MSVDVFAVSLPTSCVEKPFATAPQRPQDVATLVVEVDVIRNSCTLHGHSPFWTGGGVICAVHGYWMLSGPCYITSHNSHLARACFSTQ